MSVIFTLRPVPLFCLLSLTGILLVGCASPTKATFAGEDFNATNVHAHSFPGSDKASCEAARRALLSQGYVINEANASLVTGKKNFQPESEVHMQIAFHVVCAPDARGSNSTTVFANAVRDRYNLKKSSNSASLGVGALGSVSLPIGSTDESLVRVASETISSRDFYDAYFALMERYLDVPVEPAAMPAAAEVTPAEAPPKQ